MQALHREAYLDITYFDEAAIIGAEWKGYQSFDRATAGCTRIVELARQHHPIAVLNDDSGLRGLWIDVARWEARIWLPRLKQEGVQRVAWVYSPARFSRISVNAALASVDPDAFGLRAFDTRDEALAWLLETTPTQRRPQESRLS